MDSTRKRINELAPCGVYCGACPSFNKSCKGCSADSTQQKRQSKYGCAIRSCCYNEKHLSFCIDCPLFPCSKFKKKLLSTHKTDPRYAYRHEIPAVFKKLKDMGLDGFLNWQKKRWKCPNCGHTIYFYHYKCSHCSYGKTVYSIFLYSSGQIF